MSRILPLPSCPKSFVKIKVPVEEANFFYRVMEGYTHLAFATTLEPKEGIVAIFTTPDNYPDLMEVLANYPKGLQVLESN